MLAALAISQLTETQSLSERIMDWGLKSYEVGWSGSQEERYFSHINSYYCEHLQAHAAYYYDVVWNWDTAWVSIPRPRHMTTENEWMGQPLTSAWPRIYIQLAVSKSSTLYIPGRAGVSLTEAMLHHSVLQCVSHGRGCSVTLLPIPLGGAGEQQQLSNMGSWLRCKVWAQADAGKKNIDGTG